MTFLFLYLIGCFAAYLLQRTIHHDDTESSSITLHHYHKDDADIMILGILLSWITVIVLILQNCKK